MSKFSDFFHNATEEERRVVYLKVMEEAIKRQLERLGWTPALVSAESTSPVPWIPDALCHACGLPGGYAYCCNPNCKNKPLNAVGTDYDLTEAQDLKGK